MISAILTFLGVYRWLAMAAVIGALVLGFLGWEHHIKSVARDEGRAEVKAQWAADRMVWQGALDKQKADAALLLAAETAKTSKATGELNAARAALEKSDADAAQTIAQLRAGLRAKSRAAGGPGLRDPFAAAPGRGSGGGGAQGASAPAAVSGPANAAAPTGVLSAGFEGLLLDWADSADTINRAYAACRADSLSVRELLPK